MDVRSMAVVEVAIFGIEDEDFGEVSGGHEDVGELLSVLLTTRTKRRRRRPS